MNLNQPQAPYLSAMDLERIAYQTIDSFDASLLSRPQALDVDYFAEFYLNLKLNFLELSHNESILGMMVFSDSNIPVYDSMQKHPRIIKAKGSTILIERALLNARKQNRARFTIMHECAHWLIHRPKGPSQPFICRTVGHSDQRDWQEWQADNLASALLMPAVSIHAFMKQYVTENRESMASMYKMHGERYAIDKRFQIIRIAANTFDVSEDAAELRLIRLKYIKSKPIPVEAPPKPGTIEAMARAMFGPPDPESGFI